jgi:hypothetical protein
MLLRLVFAAAAIASAQAAVIYNEASNGDLSNSGLSPTVLTLAPGSNQILGTTGNSGGTDRDYFTFAVPLGFQLTAITVLPGTAPLGLAFIGLQAGTQVTLPTNAATADGLLGWWHYAGSDINTNILPEMAIPANLSSGFTPPLGAGNYAVWVQDFNTGASAYSFDFVLAAATVPEPATLLAVLPLIALLSARRRLSTCK